MALEPGEQRCREPRDPLGLTADEQQRLADAYVMLMPDFEVVNVYQTARADEAAVPWFEEPGNVVVGFVAHLATNRAALLAAVPHPEKLRLCQLAYTPAELDRITSELLDMTDDRFVTIGHSATSVFVELRADGAGLAAELTQRYGDLLTIRVGLFAYPLDPATKPRRGACQPLSDTAAGVGQWAVTLTVPTPTLVSGTDAELTARVTNTTDRPLVLVTGSALFAYVVRAGTRQVVGVSIGGMKLVGVQHTVEPGAAFDIPVQVGTASCDAALGFALPPGNYEVVAVLPQSGPDGAQLSLLSAPAPLTITA